MEMEGLVVSGSSDKTIHVFDPVSLELVYILAGHSDNVCALDTNSKGEIASGSWDKYVLHVTCCFPCSSQRASKNCQSLGEWDLSIDTHWTLARRLGCALCSK